jgi:hypothetical protein
MPSVIALGAHRGDMAAYQPLVGYHGPKESNPSSPLLPDSKQSPQPPPEGAIGLMGTRRDANLSQYRRRFL